MSYDRKKLIKYVTEHNSKDCNLADKIAEALDDADRIQVAILQRDEDIKATVARHKIELMAVKDNHKETISYCYHPIKTRHPDPSGNNDNWTSCDICGKEL